MCCHESYRTQGEKDVDMIISVEWGRCFVWECCVAKLLEVFLLRGMRLEDAMGIPLHRKSLRGRYNQSYRFGSWGCQWSVRLLVLGKRLLGWEDSSTVVATWPRFWLGVFLCQDLQCECAGDQDTEREVGGLNLISLRRWELMGRVQGSHQAEKCK